jgi:transposase-like protein
LVERAMAAELSEHLGYEHREAPPGGVGNARNGMTPKTLHTEHGSVRIAQPRDRQGSFEPQIVRKHQRRFEGFDHKIVAMYARGMSVRDIQAHLRELYGVEVGHDLINRWLAANGVLTSGARCAVWCGSCRGLRRGAGARARIGDDDDGACRSASEGCAG